MKIIKIKKSKKNQINLAKTETIYEKFSNKNIHKIFEKEIKGYHLINKSPIKESVWEEINRNIVKDICIIGDGANGSHISGKDNRFDNWNISNKTSKIQGKMVHLSSYRLTNVCDMNKGNKKDIIFEVKKRDASFDYYSILLRDEIDTVNCNEITYYWCIIPKNEDIFNLEKQKFDKIIGSYKNNRNKFIGWKGEYYDIRFSMSSQLWYHFTFESIKKFTICSTNVLLNNSLTYANIYDLYSNTNS
jgi:hypothetical protein